MLNIKTLSAVCDYLQVAGFALLVGLYLSLLPSFVWVLVGVTGLAAVVKIFLPLEGHQNTRAIIAASCGVGLIILSCVTVARLM
ncbi:hypothetical protein HYV44_02185 [Candidatus Microgenomates bacterium]|nr:hypothetical protein [Candidatus Microgenomates bacterium]